MQKAQSEVFIEENNIKSLKENINLQRISLTKVSGLIETGKKQGEVSGGRIGWYPSLVAEGYAPKVQQIS